MEENKYLILAFDPWIGREDIDSKQKKMLRWFALQHCEMVVNPSTHEMCIKLYVGDERLSEFLAAFTKPEKDGTYSIDALKKIEGLKVMEFKG